MANFVLHHTSAIQLFFVLVLLASSLGRHFYKKRHNNQPLPKPVVAIVGFLLGQVVIFAGFVLGVLASH